MQSLDDAVMDLLNKRRITPEDAYLHCLDKQRFRPFIGHTSDAFE